MKLNFENDYYRKEAFENSKKSNYENNNTSEDAFLLILKDIKKEDLSNLITLIQQTFIKKYNLNLTEDEAYEITQRDGLNPETAQKIGILHDYGRKYTHSFEHVIVGFEKLIDLGWNAEAIACLTHSFVNGNRCANNEPAEDGFYVDDAGSPQWEENTVKDDITKFLENYQYNEYDNILTIADLMATDKGIVSPFDRIEDIATRKKLDVKNRAYFIAEFTNKLNEFMGKVYKNNSKNEEPIKATKDVSLEQIMKKFKTVSDEFFEEYKTKGDRNIF